LAPQDASEEVMAYNEKLEEKIDAAAKQWQNVEKKKMFGGVCYLLKGNMAFGIWKDFLIVRMNKEQGEQSLKNANVQPFDITGKPMAGWVMVNEVGWKSQATLEKWINVGKEYARSLPEKKGKAKKTKTLREYKH
jgi:TfoX/Sxy family transcriptional regulator of competence genes